MMTDSQKWLVLAVGLLTLVLVYLLAPILSPFMTAFALAYLGDPLADRLERHMSRTWAVVVVFAGLVLILSLTILLLLPSLLEQVTYLLAKLPQWSVQAMQYVEGQAQRFGLEVSFDQLQRMFQEHWQQAGQAATVILKYLTSSTMSIITIAANLVLVPVISFYLLRDWDRFIAGLAALVPRRLIGKISELAMESDDVLAAFLRGQLLVMALMALIYTLGLWLAGLKLALLIGFIAGLVSFVPYLGVVMGLLMSVLAWLFQGESVLDLWQIGLVFAVAQLMEGFVFTPWLVGDRIGLHPVTVIFALAAGGQLFGFMGILLALPAAAVISVLIRHAREGYQKSSLYHGD